MDRDGLKKRWQRVLEVQAQDSLETPPARMSQLSFRPLHWSLPPLERNAATQAWIEKQLQNQAPQLAFQDSFQLKDLIGKGGMGAVFRAHQQSLGRDVAIKKLLPKQGRISERARALFLAEARLTGRLEHPNIVPVYGLSQGEGSDVCIAMKLLGGRPWRELLVDRSVPRGRHLEILMQVCNAVAYAHSRGIVHNDLKPSNVMLGSFGEVLVVDWGLAVSVGPREEGLRHHSEIDGPCGTPAYMPPELAEGNGAAVGVRTDVYLLGALLYEILMRTPPHLGASFWDIIVHAAQGRVPELDEQLPAELRAICRRALASDPEGRFPDVTSFRQALQTYQEHTQSAALVEGAHRRLAAAAARVQPGLADDQQARSALYEDFAAALAGFAQARELWEENPEARAGSQAAREQYAAAALKCGDLALAEAQLFKLREADEGLPQACQQLQARVTARRQELEREAQGRARLRRSLSAALIGLFALMALGLGLLEWQNRRTAAAKELSDARGALALETLVKMSAPFQGRLQDALGDAYSQTIAREFLSEALEGWRALRDAAVEGGEVSRGTVLTLLSYGDLLMQYEGDVFGAIREYQAARALAAQAREQASAEERPVLDTLVLRAEYSLAYAYRRSGDGGRARTHVETYLDLVAQDGGDLAEEARGLKLLAQLCQDVGELQQALDLYERAIACERSVFGVDGERDMDGFLIDSLTSRGRLLLEVGRITEATECLSLALSQAQRFVTDQPTNPDAICQRAICLADMGKLLLYKGESDSAFMLIRSAQSDLVVLCQKNPSSVLFQRQRLLNSVVLARAMRQSGAESSSIVLLSESLKQMQSIVDDDISNVEAHIQASAISIELVSSLLYAGMIDKASRQIRETELLIGRMPPQANQEELEIHRLTLQSLQGSCLKRKGEYRRAINILRSSFGQASVDVEIAHKSPRQTRKDLIVGEAMLELAELNLLTGSISEAWRGFSLANELFSLLYEIDSQFVRFKDGLSFSFRGLARAALQQSEFERSYTLFAKSKEFCLTDDVFEIEMECARARNMHGFKLLESTRPLEAEYSFSENIDELRTISVQTHSSEVVFRLSRALLGLAIAQERQGERLEATVSLEESLKQALDLFAGSIQEDVATFSRVQHSIAGHLTGIAKLGVDIEAFASAEASYTAGILNFPQNPDFYEGLGDLLRLRRDYGGAEQLYRELLELSDHASARIRMSLVQALAGQRDVALSTLEQWLSDADDRSGVVACALVHAALSGSTDRIRSFAEMDGWPGPLVRLMIDSFEENGVIDTIPAELLEPEHAEKTRATHAYLGMWHESLGKEQLAFDHYVKCLAVDGGSTRTIETLWARDRLEVLTRERDAKPR